MSQDCKEFSLCDFDHMDSRLVLFSYQCIKLYNNVYVHVCIKYGLLD